MVDSHLDAGGKSSSSSEPSSSEPSEATDPASDPSSSSVGGKCCSTAFSHSSTPAKSSSPKKSRGLDKRERNLNNDQAFPPPPLLTFCEKTSDLSGSKPFGLGGSVGLGFVLGSSLHMSGVT